MVNRRLEREFDVSEEELTEQLTDDEGPDTRCCFPALPGEINQLTVGRMVRIVDGHALVDIGKKALGAVPCTEWVDEEPPRPGDLVEVLFVAEDDAAGTVTLSRRQVRRVHAWENLIARHKVGDKVSGVVTREVKGGLLVDIGVEVFLPERFVDIRRPSSLSGFLGKNLDCQILRIDHARRGMIVSRRHLIHEWYGPLRLGDRLLATLQEGQVLRGVVKNIAEFGAFVDIGGLDGLLHIRDLNCSCISRPDEVLRMDQELEVRVLQFDRARERVALAPAHPIVLDGPWRTATVRAVADAIQRLQALDRLPILADTLEEAGCDRLDVLTHLRANRPHRQGCWVVEALTAAENAALR